MPRERISGRLKVSGGAWCVSSCVSAPLLVPGWLSGSGSRYGGLSSAGCTTDDFWSCGTTDAPVGPQALTAPLGERHWCGSDHRCGACCGGYHRGGGRGLWCGGSGLRHGASALAPAPLPCDSRHGGDGCCSRSHSTRCSTPGCMWCMCEVCPALPPRTHLPSRKRSSPRRLIKF